MIIIAAVSVVLRSLLPGSPKHLPVFPAAYEGHPKSQPPRRQDIASLAAWLGFYQIRVHFCIGSPCSSVVEHFLGKEGVTGSIPVVGFLRVVVQQEDTEQDPSCERSFNCSVPTASGATTALPRTRKIRRTSWKSRSTARGAVRTLLTRRSSKHTGMNPFGQDRPVARTARASVSKTEGWGFESLLACHLFQIADLRFEIADLRTI